MRDRLAERQKTISQMDDDELRSLIREIVKERRVPKRKEKVEKKKREKEEDEILALLKSLPPEERKKAIREMKG